MTVILTIASVIALSAFLTQLVLGLLLVFKSLESIDGIFQSITFGVRAIERETAPVDSLADKLISVSNEVSGSLRSLAGRISSAREE